MEAIKKYYRAQRPHDYDANLWDNAIDLLLANNPNASEVGRTILEANGADMFPFYFLTIGFHDFPNYDSDDEFSMGKYYSFYIFFYYDGYLEICEHGKLVLKFDIFFDKYGNWFDAFFAKIVSKSKKIKSALGLQ